MKTCPNCEINKPKTDFYKSSERYDGCQSWCKVCFQERDKKRKEDLQYREKSKQAANKSRRLKRYGVSQEQYDLLYKEQSGKCLGCQKHQSELRKSLALDHCHTTGQVRGLLCDNCNRALGFVNDNQEILKRLEVYLDNSRKLDK